MQVFNANRRLSLASKAPNLRFEVELATVNFLHQQKRIKNEIIHRDSIDGSVVRVVSW